MVVEYSGVIEQTVEILDVGVDSKAYLARIYC